MFVDDSFGSKGIAPIWVTPPGAGMALHAPGHSPEDILTSPAGAHSRKEQRLWLLTPPSIEIIDNKRKEEDFS